MTHLGTTSETTGYILPRAARRTRGALLAGLTFSGLIWLAANAVPTWAAPAEASAEVAPPRIRIEDKFEFFALRSTREPELQKALEGILAKRGLTSMVRKKKLAITLVGISDPSCPRLASVNGNQMMYAASMPKLAILLGAFKRIERGELELDDKLEDLMTRMIRYSSNTAATAVMDKVGREFIAEVLQSPEYGLYDAQYGGGLWVGRAYAKRAAWKRDPLNNLSHGATTIQVARFYYLLELGRLLPPDLSTKMKQMLSAPGVKHKFVAGILSEFPGAKMFRKSGTWKTYHADSAMVEHDGKRYIAVAMLEDPKGEQIMRTLIKDLDDLIFRIPAHCPRSVPASTASLESTP